MNPYASFLGTRDPREVIGATPGKLEQLAHALGPEGLERSLGPGKWTARQILIHLADCEIAFAFRLRQGLSEENPVIQPFDQEKWALASDSQGVQAALAVFSTLRAWNREVIEAAPPAAFSKPLRHPERGNMTFQVLVETMAGHDLNHLRQLESLAGQSSAEHANA